MRFEDKDYEVRVLYDNANIYAIPFYRNRPQNCYRYQIKIPKKVEVIQLIETEAVDSLINMAKDDILEKRGDTLTQILQKISNAKKSDFGRRELPK